MKRLTQALGGRYLWIERDDCTGLASGGKMTRKGPRSPTMCARQRPSMRRWACHATSKRGQNVVFLHNGGSVALYGYMHALKDALAA